MTPERWKEVKQLLEQALQLKPEDRCAFLDGACPSDDELRAEVASLLSEEELVRSKFLRSTPLLDSFGDGGNGRGEHEAELAAGQRFAERFQLIRKLGEGGMGQVWLAEQISPVRRQVALKLIRAGMYDESVAKRFQAERQSLAIMDHPSIAKVFDAGATAQGQPYFVMEYVPGLPITEYCDQKKLKITDRLELFIQACEGVQHAHQKAIIHRDLKPANILVVEVNGKLVPRIIDFGLAKATTPQVEGETMFTQMGHFVGTPGYMSPEQADPNVKDIDTRTDVYSLGAVLYSLLAGSQPFAAKSGETLPLDELLRKLREEEPPTPSTRVSNERETSSARAETRSTEPRQLVSLLRGDLDWITMKALEKDRSRRYGTPSELAADILRYLNHEPVLARRAGVRYRIAKYARRHRVGVSVGSLLVLLLTGFSVLQAVQLRRITRERDRANRITDFMTHMFKVSDPNQARGNSVTAREILDKASTDITRGLAKDPEAQSQMMQVMASTYLNLGLYPRAHELAKRALDSRMSLFGLRNARTLESMALLGWIVDREGGHHSEAEALERRALAEERLVVGQGAPLTIWTMDHLAKICLDEGRESDAEKLDREAVEIGTRSLGVENDEVAESMIGLGDAFVNLGRYPEAEQQYRQTIEIERRLWGPDHPETLRTMSNLALTLQYLGRFSEAERIYRQVLADQQRVLGPEHRFTAGTMDAFAGLLATEGNLTEAEKLLRQVVKIQTQNLGPEHERTLLAKSDLGEVLFLEGNLQQAEKLQRETLAGLVRVSGPEHPTTLHHQADLTATLIKEGRYAEAETLAHSTFESERSTLGLQHAYTQESMRQLGKATAHQRSYAEANKLFQDAIAKAGDASKQLDSFLWYSFACMAAALNHTDDALNHLREAARLGYKNADGLMAEDDLKSLHQNPQFQQLVAQIRQAATNRTH